MVEFVSLFNVFFLHFFNVSHRIYDFFIGKLFDASLRIACTFFWPLFHIWEFDPKGHYMFSRSLFLVVEHEMYNNVG